MKCVYCGEIEAEREILNPNGGLDFWKVCSDCEKVIALQKSFSFGSFLEQLMVNDGASEKELVELRQKILMDKTEIEKNGGFIATIKVPKVKRILKQKPKFLTNDWWLSEI